MSLRNALQSIHYLAPVSVFALAAMSAFANEPHPKGLSSAWLDKDVSELIEAYGVPDSILETAARGIVIYGDTPSVMYVYKRDPESGGNCIAAYVVELNTGQIIRYQCR